ncbi:MAG: hypothetical protein AAFO88_01250 [Pseudomonadota bacterium]
MTQPTVPDTNDRSQQVFKPVPTHEDMHALEHRVRQVQGGRARLLVMTIFLAGIVLAAAIALALMYAHTNTQLTEAQTAAEAQADLLRRKDRQIAALGATIDEKQAVIESYADFQSVAALQQQITALEGEIAALLAQPSRANAPSRLKELPEDVEWLDDVVSSLREQRGALRELKADVEAWPPALQNPRPD